MKVKEILNIMFMQECTEKKPTRAKFVGVVADLVSKHLNHNIEYYGLERTSKDRGTIINLGCAMEIVIANVLGCPSNKPRANKIYRYLKHTDYERFLNLAADIYDAEVDGLKYEIKFATTDSPAHAQNQEQKADKYVVATYSVGMGGQVFVFNNRDDIILDNQRRPIVNQRAKFLDKDLTKRVFGA